MRHKLFIFIIICAFTASGLMASGTTRWNTSFSLKDSYDLSLLKEYRTGYGQNQTYYDYTDYSYEGWKILGGLSLADVTYSRDPGIGIDDYIKRRSGFLGGIGYELGGKFGLEIDVLYIQKGVKLEGSSTDPATGLSGSFDIDAVINEISVPVVLKLRILNGSTPYIVAGGEIAYILSGKVKYTVVDASTGQTYSGTEDSKDYDELATLDYGLVFGAGFELITGAIPVFIEARYHSGMANLYKETDRTQGQAQSDDYVKSRTIVIVAGIKF